MKFIKKVDLLDFLDKDKTLIETPDVMIEAYKDNNTLSIIIPNKEDVWVFMGLSLMLINKVYEHLPKNEFNRCTSLEA